MARKHRSAPIDPATLPPPEVLLAEIRQINREVDAGLDELERILAAPAPHEANREQTTVAATAVPRAGAQLALALAFTAGEEVR